jgi:hypothetical protein
VILRAAHVSPDPFVRSTFPVPTQGVQVLEPDVLSRFVLEVSYPAVIEVRQFAL